MLLAQEERFELSATKSQTLPSTIDLLLYINKDYFVYFIQRLCKAYPQIHIQRYNNPYKGRISYFAFLYLVRRSPQATYLLLASGSLLIKIRVNASMVAPAGIEPSVSALKGQRLNRLTKEPYTQLYISVQLPTRLFLLACLLKMSLICSKMTSNYYGISFSICKQNQLSTIPLLQSVLHTLTNNLAKKGIEPF